MSSSANDAFYFYDRLKGTRSFGIPTGKTPLGRWIVRAHAGAEVFLNSVPIKEGFLVPESSGAWRLVTRTGDYTNGSFWQHQFPEELEQDSIKTIGEHLQELVDNGGSWLDWLDIVPLAPGMSDSSDLTPLELCIQDLIGHLEEVCRKPRAHLQVDIDRVPVASARRLPARAASYLASHTEDWEKPLIRGVLPKRVLAEVRHDRTDIYENRVAARLVDHLSHYLAKRIRQIRKLLKVFKDKDDYSNAVGGTYFRQRRILQLWGESIDSKEGEIRADSTLKKLEWLRYRLMGLMDSRLYREVPRKTFVPPTLRTTNILANDQNYRRVAELWRAWVNAGHGRTLTPEDVHREANELCQGMINFCFLIAVRALDQLGFEIVDSQMNEPLGRPGQWRVSNNGNSAILELDEFGRIRISAGNRVLTLVPLPANISAAPDDSRMQEVLKELLDAAPSGSDMSLVLYAGDPSERTTKLSSATRDKLLTFGNDPRAGLPAGLGFIPVSPWDIASVERVSRALRWFVDSTRFDEYPPTINVPVDAQGVLDLKTAKDWLSSKSDGAQLVVKRPPQKYEWDALSTKEILASAKEAHRRAVADHERISQELKAAVRQGRPGSLNKKKSQAHQDSVSKKQRLGAVQVLVADLEEAYQRATSLLLCPGCETPVDPIHDFKIRSDDCFRSTCPGCGTTWAKRFCSKGHRYSVMLPGGNFVDADDHEFGWEDRSYGSDLLVNPARMANGSWGFVCPECGDVT